VRRAAQVRVARARQAASVDGQAEARTAAPGGWLRLPPPLLDLMESWIKALKTIVQMLCITRLELRAKWMASGGGVSYFLLLTTGKVAEREQEAAHSCDSRRRVSSGCLISWTTLPTPL